MLSKNVLDLFHPVISGWFHQEYGQASPPQDKGWPAIASGKHTLILSPTGSGKTLAAFLWCINDIFCKGLSQPAKSFQKNAAGVHTLYISPLKALNNDIQRNLQTPLREISRQSAAAGLSCPDINVLVRTGDTPAAVRRTMVQKPPHILITTPESLYLLLTSVRGREIFHNVRFLIIDEIHALSNNKRGVHLSLSLERLMSLNETEPVRIGLSATQRPLQRIADFLGGQKYRARDDTFRPRPVTIVECPRHKKLMLQVLSPVDDFSDLPQSTVWPSVIQTLYNLIRQHQTTLIFANMRAQAEKIARQLNELHRQQTGDPQAELVFPHHGSMSREMRFEIENRLKNGTLPAVVATASLELGIDIGSIDLVVQLEAPKSISGSLQRIGRSGHMLDQASKGIIIPLYPSDLDDAAALSSCLEQGTIEETVIPENCLDILAQQILAEVASHNQKRLDLFNLFRQSYCYRHLTLPVWDRTLEMLSGNYAHKRLPALQPRLTWDRVNDQLIARPGTRLTAIMNGGTIPDHGYYAVMMADSNIRLGEMEEEFVFESRAGDVFYLGNHEWRIDNIQRDRIIVTPVKSIRPRPPFWKGEIPSRDHETCLRVGTFRHWLTENLDQPWLENQLQTSYHLDQKSTVNLINYTRRQKAQLGFLPTHRRIVVEWFQDEMSDLNIVIHAPFGGRVNSCWALALITTLEKQYQTEIRWSYNDDGILIRLLAMAEPPVLELLFQIPVHEIEHLVKTALTLSPLFAIQFRYNAARALLLERSRPGKRIPLWLQRLRAADLLQLVRDLRDFPIILETYRSCLEDIFDLPALFKIIKKILTQEIQIHLVHTPFPSAMASSLLFNFLSNQMYERDRVQLSAEVSMVSNDLLAEILNSESIPPLVTAENVTTVSSRWQNLSDSTRARGAEDLFLIIEKLGPLDTDELQQRANTQIGDWLQTLQDQNRITHINSPLSGWISGADQELYNPPWNPEKIRIRLQKYMSSQGPLTSQELSARLKFEQTDVEEALRILRQSRDVVSGTLIKGTSASEILWCDRNNFAYLYRQAVTSRRLASAAANRQHHFEFILQWHGIATEAFSLAGLVEHYQGIPLPLHFFEREILATRRITETVESYADYLSRLRQIVTAGQVYIHTCNTGTNRVQLIFTPHGGGNLFANYPTAAASGHARQIFNFLRENGASYLADLEQGSGLSPVQVRSALQDLTAAGLITCDDYDSYMEILNSASQFVSPEETAGSQKKSLFNNSESRSLNRGDLQQRIKIKMQLKSGRWFLCGTFAVSGKAMSEEDRIEQQARLLLKRHGFLVKELFRLENGFESWYKIFQMLKKLEWQGEILRGYFIEGLSGIQYALPQAVTLLEKIVNKDVPSRAAAVLLSTMDPALPFGRNIEWNICDQKKEKVAVTRMAGNHLFFISGRPLVYMENYAARLVMLDGCYPELLPALVQHLKNWLLLPAGLRPRKRIEIENINSTSAADYDRAGEFIRLGFEQDGKKLILWPSRAQ
jgi:ATP-dependent Lhr-like helicase